MVKFFQFFFYNLLLLTSLSIQIDASQNKKNKEYMVLHCREGAGMFSIFDDVLALFKCYEKGFYEGIEIDFSKEGLYYSSDHGDNWWSYYCDPITLGCKKNMRHIVGDPPGSLPSETEFHTSRVEARRLISKYFTFKPEIMNKISQFEWDHFNGFVITVHYRGTDRILEAPPVAFIDIVAKINEVALRYGADNYKIFIATDEQKFIDYMVSIYGSLVCFNTEALRSTDGNPLHMGNYDRYQCGFDAIVDSILLSRGQYLIRMSSNLSRWSTYFNPNIPVYELNQRY